MKKLRPGNTRLRLHGNNNEAQKLRTFAMRKLQGFLSTCDESMQICGPWKVEFSDGSWVKLSQLYDQPVIDIFVPILAEPGREDLIGKERRWKERKEKRIIDPVKSSTIVPGFCIVEPKTVSRNPSHDDGDIIVCGDATWDAFRLYDFEKDIPYVVEDQIEATPVGPLWAEGLPVISKRGWWNFETNYESNEGDPDTEDTLFVPGPLPAYGHYDGDSPYAGVRDHAKEALLSSAPLWDYGGGGYYCGDSPHLFDNTWPEEWGHHSLFPIWHRNDAECLEYQGSTPCCRHMLGRTLIEPRGSCSMEHLFVYYGLASNREEAEGDMGYLMGLCIDGKECIAVHKTLEFVNTYSGEQSRLRTETIWTQTEVKSHRDEEHNFIIAEAQYDLVYTIEAGIAHSDCIQRRVDTREFIGEQDNVAANYDGGVVEEYEEVQPWFCLYTKTYYDNEANKNFSSWELWSGSSTWSGAPRYYFDEYKLPTGYLENPEDFPHIQVYNGYHYNHGIFKEINPNFTADNETINHRLQLIASVMGQDVVIDEKEDSENYIFRTLHSNVFNAEGRPIFMYSYCLIKIEENGGETIEYIKYGYFDTTHERHIESEQYEPAGLYVVQFSRRYDLPYHDVFNSFEQYGKYACGLCSAFNLNRQISYEQEYEMTYMEPEHER